MDYALPARWKLVDQGVWQGKPYIAIQPIYRTLGSARTSMTELNVKWLARKLRQNWVGSEEVALWMNHAEYFSYHLGRELARSSKRCFFDSSDDFTTFAQQDEQRFKEQLHELFDLAECVLCINETVAQRINHPYKLVASNCTEYDTLARVDDHYQHNDLLPKTKGVKYIGFIGGVIEGRIDWPLLKRLLETFPHYRFVFIGYTNSITLKRDIEAFSNGRFFPEVPYEKLGTVIAAFDVAIVPHLDNALTQGNDLLKVLDYFAAGAPVVSTNCSNVQKYGEALYIANSADEFENFVRELADGTRIHDPSAGIAIAKERSWSVQAPRLAQKLFGD